MIFYKDIVNIWAEIDYIHSYFIVIDGIKFSLDETVEGKRIAINFCPESKTNEDVEYYLKFFETEQGKTFLESAYNKIDNIDANLFDACDINDLELHNIMLEFPESMLEDFRRYCGDYIE